MKKLLALLLAAALIFTACGSAAIPYTPPPDIENPAVASRSFNIQPLAAEEQPPASAGPLSPAHTAMDLVTPRDGYTLAPTMVTATGLDPLSAFILTTPYAFPASQYPTLSIDGAPAPAITQESPTTFHITPAVPLSPNAVYMFRLAADGRADITWAFQTTARFVLASTLPRHQATNVPVETGIEFNFSLPGETDIADHFTITPHVDGRFIHRGSTAIFMPTNPLEHLQIYTVTLSAGIALATGEETAAG
ncbi:MAG: Ig-like domain-containing protein, partial [Defluviitaleaceae bacterium]|nr:Ig-like domain-containing protein [Defluviitaleaceae bacterium]